MIERPLGIPRRIWCHLIAATIGFVFVAPLTFMALDRADPVVVHFTAFSGEMRPGSVMTITWDATSFRACEGTVRRRVIDHTGSIYEYDEQATVIRPEGELGRRKYRREFILPKSIAVGQATHAPVVRYYCNPIQYWLNWPIVAQRTRETFIVVD